MRKHGTLAAFVAVVTLLPVGAAEGRSDLDSEAPFLEKIVTGEKGANGWYVGDTTIGWRYGPPEEILRTRGCEVDTVTEETQGDVFLCTVWTADDELSLRVVLMLDRTPPSVNPHPTRAADRNGWFNHAVDFLPGATDAVSGVDEDTCTALPTYTGPDRANVRITATCRDMAGHQATGSFRLDYDDTAPTARGKLARRPDLYGWYARDVRVSFTGADETSGLAGCLSRVYRGPDTSRASVTGWCRDRAGNQRNRTRWFKFSKPLLQPRSGTTSSPPLLDWITVSRALEYNAQVWHEGRKILSRWPDKSRLQLGRSWSYLGREYRLRRGERYKVYVWPRFRNGYGRMLGQGKFTFVRSSSGSELVSETSSER